MRLNSQNFNILYFILISWLKVFFQIHFRNPAEYLETLNPQAPSAPRITEKQWTISKKVVKGTRTIRFLFQKSRRCLVESLIVFDVLKQFDINANLHFGARKVKESIQTHAWVTLEEKTVIGGPTVNFRKLIRTH